MGLPFNSALPLIKNYPKGKHLDNYPKDMSWNNIKILNSTNMSIGALGE